MAQFVVFLLFLRCHKYAESYFSVSIQLNFLSEIGGVFQIPYLAFLVDCSVTCVTSLLATKV